MSNKHNNEISNENLKNVSGGINFGMANPYNAPEKKQAYQKFKDGAINLEQFRKIMGIETLDNNKFKNN